MPASFATIQDARPTKGASLFLMVSSQARYTHMNKQIDITGGMSLASILTEFGKVVNNSKRKVTLTFDILSTFKLVKGGVQANKQDKDTAFAQLNDSEKAAVVKYEVAIKAAAAARDTGALVERWTITGTATQG